MLGYIWNKHGKLPGEIYNLPPLEKELVYQMTLLQIKQAEAEAKKARQGVK